MKILKKVRLINWHRFQDETIEFAESVLLSGENGAGKSTILDAIQFVITCSKAHFNKAAHEKGKRNLNSYMRCKTGREDRPYERTGELTAHIALEFYDEAKKRPFIIGAVMDSASEEKEPNVAWYLMENKELKDSLFKKGNQVKSISSFRSTNQKEIHTYAGTIKEAQKMILSRFGRLEDKFFSLIPKALAFKPIHDIKDFVYSYVLDEKEVNIDVLKENVRSYQDLERMLQDVKRRIEELNLICTRERELEQYLRRDKYQQYYIARAQKELTEEKADLTKNNIRYEELSSRDWERKKAVSIRNREEKEQLIRNLAIELNSDEDYQAFRELERKEAELKSQIKDDKNEVKELHRAVKLALADAQKLLQVQDVDACVAEYKEILEKLDECDSLVSVSLCLENVIAYKEKMYQRVQEKIAEINVEIRKQKDDIAKLEHNIRELEAKRLIYPPMVSELRSKIVEELGRLNRKAEVRILCELLEMKDAKWQNAVEGYLNTQRFYLLVEPGDFDIALSVYEKQRGQKKVYGVGLINTGKLEKYDDVPVDSLAEKVSSKNVWARRYINMVLGKVHCCDSYQELKNYPVSITRQCMRYQNHVVSAISPDIYETPYIGAEAYKKQLEQCRQHKVRLEQVLNNLQNRKKNLEFVVEPLSAAHDIDVKYRLKSLENLRIHEKALSDCKESMRQLEASQTMIQKRIRMEALQNEKNQLDKEVQKAAGQIARCEERISHYQEEIENLRELLVKQTTELAQLTAGLEEDFSYCEKEYLRQTDGKVLDKFIENFERARKANWTLKEKAEGEMIAAMRSYKVAHDFGAAESLSGYPEFLAEYEKLKNSQLLEYEDKVYQARKAAEEEFKEQFLSRLQENIKQAQGEFKELNRALKEIHFSKEQYEFLYEPNSGLKKYYQMIMSDFNVMQGESIFSGMFNEMHKEVIDELFEKLTLDDEKSSKTLEEYTDYRTYMDYDIKISNEDGSYMLYSKVSQEKSGGETQTPFYITIAASFMQLYRNSIGGDSIGLVMMDEAFNNMDDERIAGVLSFMNHSNLQMVIAAPPDKIQYIGPAMKKVLLVLQDDKVSYVEDFTREAV
ncbi:MAG: AAA family ATPase [Lachnospiraceae bacterium]|nr:AAA family ATPase [Lachnospiraceae bacterium]